MSEHMMDTWTTPDDELHAICAELEADGCWWCGAEVLVRFFASPYFHAVVECERCGSSDEADLSGEAEC